MEELLDAYQTYLRSWQASESTIRARMTLARSRLKAWGVDGFTVDNISTFLAVDSHGERRKKWTTATYFNHLNDLCSFLVAANLLEESPMDAMKRAKRPLKRPNPLSDDDIERVMSVVKGEIRDWISLALLEGLRCFEVAKIKGEDFSSAGLYVLGKGSVEAVIPVHPEIEAMAGRYPEKGYWFPGSESGHVRPQQISLTVSKLFTSLGIDGSIHRCRHAYATRLLRSGANVRVVQRLMRHASLDTTAGYLAVAGDEERDALLRLTA